MLFEKVCIKQLDLKNAIVMPPMCNYQAHADGLAREWHVLHYATRAIGQVGLIIMESAGVQPGGRISSNDLGLWRSEQVEGLKSIVDVVHRQGSKIAIQLNHAGRKSTVENVVPVAPSAIAYSEDYPVPQELTRADLEKLVEDFAAAAARAVAIGFDAIEIHGAHGYLINQFLSPLTNKRTDEYGGSLENRARLLGEVLTGVRSVIPSVMPLCVRVSASEYEAGGNTPEITAGMLNLVKGKGLDLVNVSSGGVTPQAPKAYPSYQIDYALTVKKITALPVIGGGLVTEPLQAEQIIRAGCDLVYIGRELLRNPYWPLRAAHALKQEIEWPKPYERAKYI